MISMNSDNRLQSLLSVRETGFELGLSRSSIYALLAQGRLRAVKLGKRTLIPRESISTFVESLPSAHFATAAMRPAARNA